MEKFPSFQKKEEKKNSLASMALEKISNDQVLFAELAKEVLRKEPYMENVPLAVIQESLLLYIGENYVSDGKGKKNELMGIFNKIVGDLIGENKAEIANLMDVYEKKILPEIKKVETEKGIEPKEEKPRKLYFDQKMAAAGDDDPNEE